MTAILLDTNALLWLVSTPERIVAPVLEQLADPGNDLIVSAVTAWEIAIKTKIGRFDGEPLLSSWSELLADMNAVDLPIDSADAVHAGRLGWEHKDPFDRMLVTQAIRRGYAVATSDAVIVEAGLVRTLNTHS